MERLCWLQFEADHDWFGAMPEFFKTYRQIKEKIITLRLPPASMIDEERLANQMNIGLTPVRQALRRLALENLVVILPRRGTMVADLNLADLQKIFELRVELETLAARLAAQRATPEQIAAVSRAQIPAGSVAISEAPGVVQSLAEFCKSKPAPKLPDGQLSLDGACAPAFVAKHPEASLKTVQPGNTVFLAFGVPAKVDEVCGLSRFKAPMCRGFRPGDTVPGVFMNY